MMKLTKTMVQQGAVAIIIVAILMAKSLLKVTLLYLCEIMLVVLQLFVGRKLNGNIRNYLFQALRANSDIEFARTTNNSKTMSTSASECYN